MTPEEKFELELTQFRADTSVAIRCFYIWLAFNDYTNASKPALGIVNRTPLFWRTNLASLQANLFIALGRIFDKDPRSHSLARLLDLAVMNPQIFSRESLAKRKHHQSPDAIWIPSYVADAYVPGSDDFSRLSRFVRRKRDIYNSAYSAIRRKIFAHNDVLPPGVKDSLFAKTQLGEIQRLLSSLNAFYEAMNQLYINGRKPIIRRGGMLTINQMRLRPASHNSNESMQERAFGETYSFLNMYTGGAEKIVGARRRKRL